MMILLPSFRVSLSRRLVQELVEALGQTAFLFPTVPGAWWQPIATAGFGLPGSHPSRRIRYRSHDSKSRTSNIIKAAIDNEAVP